MVDSVLRQGFERGFAADLIFFLKVWIDVRAEARTLQHVRPGLKPSGIARFLRGLKPLPPSAVWIVFRK